MENRTRVIITIRFSTEAHLQSQAFFFHGMSGNFTGAFGAWGLATCNSDSASACAEGGAMFPRQEAMRDCNA